MTFHHKEEYIVISRIRRKKPNHQETMKTELQESMASYASSLKDYNHFLRNSNDSGSPEALMMFQQTEAYRVRYYTLRVHYEATYGNLQAFQERLNTFFEWVEERDMRCLVQRPHDQIVVKSVLAQL